MTETAAADAVRYETDGPVARITLNRPDKLNAINGQVHDGILSALARAAADDAVRAVVLRGNGRAFSAGGDLKAVAAGEEMGHARLSTGPGPLLVGRQRVTTRPGSPLTSAQAGLGVKPPSVRDNGFRFS